MFLKQIYRLTIWIVKDKKKEKDNTLIYSTIFETIHFS